MLKKIKKIISSKAKKKVSRPAPKKRAVSAQKKKKASPKIAKKKIVKKAKTAKPKKEIVIGQVTHYFGKVRVAVVKMKKDVRVGTEVLYRGATTNFSDAISSMQKDHKDIKIAKKGQTVGVKVKKKVRRGDKVFLSE